MARGVTIDYFWHLNCVTFLLYSNIYFLLEKRYNHSIKHTENKEKFTGTYSKEIFNGSYGKRTRFSGLNNEWRFLRKDDIVNK